MSFLVFLAILGNTRVMLVQPFCERQVIFIQGNFMPGFLGFSWQNSSLKLQPFHESQVILILVSVIPGFLGYSWQCNIQLVSWLYRLSKKAKIFWAFPGFLRQKCMEKPRKPGAPGFTWLSGLFLQDFTLQ